MLRKPFFFLLAPKQFYNSSDFFNRRSAAAGSTTEHTQHNGGTSSNATLKTVPTIKRTIGVSTLKFDSASTTTLAATTTTVASTDAAKAAPTSSSFATSISSASSASPTTSTPATTSTTTAAPSCSINSGNQLDSTGSGRHHTNDRTTAKRKRWDNKIGSKIRIGIVKSWWLDKGFGFIVDIQDKDSAHPYFHFVHYSDLKLKPMEETILTAAQQEQLQKKDWPGAASPISAAAPQAAAVTHQNGLGTSSASSSSPSLPEDVLAANARSRMNGKVHMVLVRDKQTNHLIGVAQRQGLNVGDQVQFVEEFDPTTRKSRAINVCAVGGGFLPPLRMEDACVSYDENSGYRKSTKPEEEGQQQQRPNGSNTTKVGGRGGGWQRQQRR